MLCQRGQRSPQRDGPEADGVHSCRGDLLLLHVFLYFLQWYKFLSMSPPPKELQWGVCKVPGQPGGGTVGPDHFLWLQHPNLCPSCQFA